MSSLTVHDPGGQDTRVVLDPQRPTVMGRDGSCEVVLGHPSISRRHAIVRFQNGAYRVEDLSTNGLFVNGNQVKPTSSPTAMSWCSVPPTSIPSSSRAKTHASR